MSVMNIVTQKATQSLIAHSLCKVPSAWRVSVALEREASGALNIRYTMPRRGLRLPVSRDSTSSPTRVDGLWHHSCVELFVAVPGNSAYREFNFAADGRWAAFDFVDYREPAAYLPQIFAPRIVDEIVGDAICIKVHLDATTLQGSAELQFGATAVLESDDGDLSYWAVCHPTDKPDFHHRDGFVLTLA